jgi:phage terminase large subunit-like protein
MPLRPKKTAKRPPPPEIQLAVKQDLALGSKADITIFGGGNGGGKTQALVFLPQLPEYFSTPGCSIMLFAESVPKLTQPKGLIDKCNEWYAPFHPEGEDGFHKTQRRWTFPTAKDGAPVTITLSYVGEPGQWDGAEAAVIGVDQVEQIDDKQFFSLVSRNRTTCGARPRVFCTANPPADGREHWLTKLLTAGGWIGEDGYPLAEMDGKVRYFVRVGDDFVFGDTADELLELAEKDRAGRPIRPKSFTFVQALVDDHPDAAFAEAYRETLATLPEVERLRRLRGNWYVIEEAGKYFQRTMFLPPLEYQPSRSARQVRSWDNAWSTSEKADWTPGILESMEPDGAIYICDLLRFRGTFSHVERAVEAVAEVDGREVTIRLPKDAGAAGGLQSALAQRLGGKGYHVVLTADRGDKMTRSKPYQGCAERKQVRLANLHLTASVARALREPFEQYDREVRFDREGRRLPPQLVRVEGLDVSNISTINGWHESFLEDHVKFGRDTVAKKHIKKDCVDAAVGGYEFLVSDQEESPRKPTAQQGQAMDEMKKIVTDLFGEQSRGLKV